jgi:hypothetical protein
MLTTVAAVSIQYGIEEKKTDELFSKVEHTMNEVRVTSDVIMFSLIDAFDL